MDTDTVAADPNCPIPVSESPGRDGAPPWVLRGLSGLIASGLILGLGQLFAAFADRGAAPLYVVGDAVIELVPDSVREFAINEFGTNDKTVLLITIGVIVAILAIFAGLTERPSRPIGSLAMAIFGALGVIAATTRPNASWTWFMPTAFAVAIAIVAFRYAICQMYTQPPVSPGLNRRAFLLGMIGTGAGAAAAGVGGIAVDHVLNDVGRDRAKFAVPTPTNGSNLPSATVADFITDNNDFYRIDTALRPPQITASDWKLHIHGMVDREITLDMAALRSMPAFDKLVTLTCVSNEVGGDLVGNAQWTGYRLNQLLAMARPAADADMVLSTSADGFTAGTPITALTDAREAMLAVAMNGKPLPIEHGYPARMVVPGLYGYVSATKWVVSLEVTRFDKAKAYWTTRGWSAKGPIKTSSRIDVPRSGDTVKSGSVTVGGVAWAQQRGINRVEVQIDDGAWQRAELLDPDLIDTWRLWRFSWDAAQGDHNITVRAYDGDGRVQNAVPTDPVPDGASGLHTIGVHISS